MEVVSVVIPVCNRPAELKRAIGSVLSQSNVEVEIIVVENNSIDPVAVKKAVLEFKRDNIRYYSLADCDNGNVARNYGASKASGELISFLDSDDEWDTDHLENAVSAMKTHNAEFVYGGGRISDGETVRVRPSRQLQSAEKPIDFLLGPGGGYAQTSSFLIRKDAFRKVYWDETFRRHQDYDFFIRAASALKTGFNPRADYTIHWKKGEKRNFDFDSFKRFYTDYGSQMSIAAEVRYLLIMIKVSFRDAVSSALMFYLLQVMLVPFKRLARQAY